MKGYLAGCFFTMMCCSGAASAAGGTITGVVGMRQIDEDQWAPTDTQGLLGAYAAFSFWDFPLHLELGLRGSSDDEDDGFADYEQRIGELSVGAMLIPDYGYVRPFFVFGVSAVNVEVEVDDQLGRDRDEDETTGLYIGGGVLWQMAPNFVLGMDARYLGGTEVRIFGEDDFDVDGFTVAMRLGYSWDFHRYRDRGPPPRRPPRRH